MSALLLVQQHMGRIRGRKGCELLFSHSIWKLRLLLLAFFALFAYILKVLLANIWLQRGLRVNYLKLKACVSIIFRPHKKNVIVCESLKLPVWGPLFHYCSWYKATLLGNTWKVQQFQSMSPKLAGLEKGETRTFMQRWLLRRSSPIDLPSLWRVSISITFPKPGNTY